jgi:PBP1b-binding outer membrane lipoprotein LpoB
MFLIAIKKHGMKKLLIVALGAMLLTGCTTPARNYVPQTKQISIPPLKQ